MKPDLNNNELKEITTMVEIRDSKLKFNRTHSQQNHFDWIFDYSLHGFNLTD